MSANVENIEKAIAAINTCNKCVRLYEAGKEALADGIEVDFPAATITALKQKFAAARTECKAALDAITG